MLLQLIELIFETFFPFPLIFIYKLVNFPEEPTILENIFWGTWKLQKKITISLKFTFTHPQFFFWSLQRVELSLQVNLSLQHLLYYTTTFGTVTLKLTHQTRIHGSHIIHLNLLFIKDLFNKWSTLIDNTCFFKHIPYLS